MAAAQAWAVTSDKPQLERMLDLQYQNTVVKFLLLGGGSTRVLMSPFHWMSDMLDAGDLESVLAPGRRYLHVAFEALDGSVQLSCCDDGSCSLSWLLDVSTASSSTAAEGGQGRLLTSTGGGGCKPITAAVRAI